MCIVSPSKFFLHLREIVLVYRPTRKPIIVSLSMRSLSYMGFSATIGDHDEVNQAYPPWVMMPSKFHLDKRLYSDDSALADGQRLPRDFQREDSGVLVSRLPIPPSKAEAEQSKPRTGSRGGTCGAITPDTRPASVERPVRLPHFQAHCPPCPPPSSLQTCTLPPSKRTLQRE